MNDTIKEWYEKKDNVAEMRQWKCCHHLDADVWIAPRT